MRSMIWLFVAGCSVPKAPAMAPASEAAAPEMYVTFARRESACQTTDPPIIATEEGRFVASLDPATKTRVPVHAGKNAFFVWFGIGYPHAKDGPYTDVDAVEVDVNGPGEAAVVAVEVPTLSRLRCSSAGNYQLRVINSPEPWIAEATPLVANIPEGEKWMSLHASATQVYYSRAKNLLRRRRQALASRDGEPQPAPH